MSKESSIQTYVTCAILTYITYNTCFIYLNVICLFCTEIVYEYFCFHLLTTGKAVTFPWQPGKIQKQSTTSYCWPL